MQKRKTNFTQQLLQALAIAGSAPKSEFKTILYIRKRKYKNDCFQISSIIKGIKTIQTNLTLCLKIFPLNPIKDYFAKNCHQAFLVTENYSFFSITVEGF